MEITVRFALFLSRCLGWFIAPIFLLMRYRKSRKLPPIQNNLLLMSATCLADKIRKREIKCHDVVKAYITRIKEVDIQLNAVVEDRFEKALMEARRIDDSLDRYGSDELQLLRTKPLLGVPITIKESCSVKGMSYNVGSIWREGMRAQADGDVVARLRDAGAIIMAVTNTPEYCLYWECNNKVNGRTSNPYNENYSPAGSSGGEGALLGAGASVIGIGSDVAGSIRLPGLLNGVFGHKGSANLVSTNGHFPGVQTTLGKSNLVIGPMVRYAEDLPLLFKIIVDSTNDLQLDVPVELKKLNIFHMHDFDQSFAFARIDCATKEAIDKCVQHLKVNVGCSVDGFKFSLQNAVEIAAAVLIYLEDSPNILQNPKSKTKPRILMEIWNKLLGSSQISTNGLLFSLLRECRGFLLPFRRQKYLDELDTLKQEFRERLKTNGVLICPSFPTSSYCHNEFIFKFGGVQYQSIFNNLGLPSTNVPLGIGSNGMPIGVQIVAGPQQDRLCFAVAQELQRKFGGWSMPK